MQIEICGDARARVAATLMVMMLGASTTGCALGSTAYELWTSPVVDMDTGAPISRAAVVVITESTPWHLWDDPCTAPYSTIRVEQIKALDPQHPTLTVRKDHYSGHALWPLFFVVRHEYLTYILFAPGYYLSVTSHPHHAPQPIWRGGKLRALGRRESKDETSLSAYVRTFEFVVGLKGLWGCLQERYEAGRGKEAIAIVCEAMCDIQEALKRNETARELDEQEASTMAWCRRIGGEP